MKRFLSGLSFVMLVFFIAACNAAPSHVSDFPIEVIKSPNDLRDYRYLTLENGLKLILVSNPGANNAAAAVGVHAGSLDEPAQWPGLAHFLEHTISMGSRLYPDPDEYDNYLNEHGGYNNAWTSDYDTVYFFKVVRENFQPALERVASFFKEPLFASDYLNRERHAVDSEYQIHRQEDYGRFNHVVAATSNPQHPSSRFSIGTLDTLSDHDGLKVRDALIDFHKTWYTGPNISVALVADESLDTLETMARELFIGITSRRAPVRSMDLPEYTSKELGLRIDIQSKQQLRTLSLSFPLPVDPDYLQDKPMLYVAHIIGSESKGSLISYLKRKGWIKDLSAWGSDNTRIASFDIQAALTEKGYEHIDDILAQIFATLKQVYDHGIHKDIFTDIQTQQNLWFRFMERAEPDKTASMLVTKMPNVAPAQLMSSRFTIPRFNPEKIRQMIRRLTPDNMRMILTSDILPVPEADALKEPWTNALYTVNRFTPEQITHYIKTPLNKAVTLPELNPYLPKTLDVIEEKQTETPDVLPAPENMRSWFHHNNSFKVPKGSIYTHFATPTIPLTTENLMMLMFYVRLFNTQFNESLYPASQAGLDYGLLVDDLGLLLVTSGYNEPLPLFYKDLVTNLQNFSIDRETFLQQKEFIREELNNIDEMDATDQVYRVLSNIIYTNESSVADRIAALNKITLEALVDLQEKLFSDLALTTFIHGNLSREDAGSINQYLSPLATNNTHNSSHVQLKSIPKTMTPQSCAVYYKHEDSALLSVTIQPSKSVHDQMVYRILGRILKAPFFTHLRNDEQLGYVVFASSIEHRRYPGLIFVIQSPEHAPSYLSERVDNFLSNFKTHIDGLTKEDLENHRSSLITQFNPINTQMFEESEQFWSDVDDGFLNFDQKQQQISALKKVSLEDIQQAYRKLLAKEHWMQIFGYGNNRQPEDAPVACNDPSFRKLFKTILP